MIITQAHQISAALDLINKSQILCIDIETTGLNTRKDSIIGVGLSTDSEAVYLTHLTWNSEDKQLEQLLSKPEITQVLERLKTKQLTGWNAKFDLKFIQNYFSVDLVPNLWSDGMLAKHTVDEEFPFGLKEVAAKVFGEDAKKEQEEMKASIRKNGGTATEYYKADLDLMAKYCMQDCLLAYRLNAKYVEQLKKEKLTKFYFEDEVMPLYREVTIPMEQVGVHLDMNLLASSQAAITADLKMLEQQIYKSVAPHLNKFEAWFLNKEYPVTTTGPFIQALCEILDAPLPKLESGRYSLTAKNLATLPEDHTVRAFMENRLELPADLIAKVRKKMHGNKPMLNLSSKHHLKKIFFEELKETPISRTELGNPQVDDEFLESIKHKHEFVQLLIDYNRLVKIKGSYIDRLMDEQEDGIWYPAFHQHRTVSGRYGSDAQQMPRKIKPRYEGDPVAAHNNVIRDLIIAADDEVLIGADYTSLEPVVFSHVSGDENLKNIFRKGHDFYSTIAIRTESLAEYSPDKKASNYLGKLNPEKRQLAKSYCLGVPYGMTGYKLKFELNCSQEEAERLVKNYLDAFPALHEFMKRSKEYAKVYGVSKSEAGRVRHLKRAKWIYAKHGDSIADSLELWKKYNETPKLYQEMKELRKTYINELNNAINFKIQSLAASIINRSAIKIMRKYKEQNINAKICLQLHDELVIRCAESEAKKAAKIMQECMENTYKLSVPLIAEPVIGHIYGEIK